MRRIDLHCWTAKTEAKVIKEFTEAGVEAVLVAFDIETASGTPPCTNEYVARMRDDSGGRVIQGLGGSRQGRRGDSSCPSAWSWSMSCRSRRLARSRRWR